MALAESIRRSSIVLPAFKTLQAIAIGMGMIISISEKSVGIIGVKPNQLF